MQLATFWDNYGLIILLIVVCVAMMIFYFLKHRKQENDIQEFEDGLKVGDRVKTYSGFYGEIENITLIKENDNQVRIVTLKLGPGSSIDVDIRAIGQIDKREYTQGDKTLDEKVAELRKKENLAKRDQTRANTTTFRPTSQQNQNDNANVEKQPENVEKEVAEKKEENPVEVEPKQEQKQELKKFVPKQFEKRSFSPKPKADETRPNDNGADGDSKK